MNRSQTFLKVVSSLVLQVFFVQQVAFAAPEIRPLNFSISEKPSLVFKLPYSVAFIQDSYKAPGSDKLVVLLQDAHTNESGQLNIARALESILSAEKIRLVFLEAGSGDVSLSGLRTQAPAWHRKSVGLSYLRKGLLQGSEYLNLTSDLDFELWGVEDPEFYKQAVETYRRIVDKREQFHLYLTKVKMTLDVLKPKIFNPSLRVLESQFVRFKKNDLAMTDYFALLSMEAAKADISLDAFPHLKDLDRVRRSENKIDFDRASREQQQALLTLSNEDQKLLHAAADEDKGPSKLSSTDPKERKAFYALLGEKIKDYTPYPELRKYLKYLEATHKIDPQSILEEQSNLEKRLFDHLINTEDERRLFEAQNALFHLESIFNLSITPDDYAQFKQSPLRHDIILITGFLNKKISDLKQYFEKAVFLEPGFEAALNAAEEFYELTYARDRVFVKNMFDKMTREGQSKAVLITGGYHTPNLKELLKSQGVSFVSIMPQILHETDHKRYERILLGQNLNGDKFDIAGHRMKHDQATTVSTLQIRMTSEYPVFYQNIVAGKAAYRADDSVSIEDSGEAREILKDRTRKAWGYVKDKISQLKKTLRGDESKHQVVLVGGSRTPEQIASDFKALEGKDPTNAQFLSLGNGRVLISLFSNVFKMGSVVMAQTFGSNVSEMMKEANGNYKVVHMSGDREEKREVTVDAVAATGSIDDEEGLQELFKLIDSMNPPDDYLVIPYGVTDGVLVQGAELSADELADPENKTSKYIRDLYRVIEYLVETKPKLKISVINSDNKDGNGTLITDMLMRLASLARPEVARAIKDRVRVHETMVDLIANPYKDDATGEYHMSVPEVEATLPKEHVVLEDAERFIPEQAAQELEKYGFIIAREKDSVIKKYHPKKLRIMNAVHTALVAAAALSGVSDTGPAIRDTDFERYVRNLYEKDIVVISQELNIPRSEIDKAFEEWLERINRMHSTFWIAQNFPSKALIRFLPTILANLSAGKAPSKEMAYAFVANLRYLTSDSKSADPLKPGVYMGFLDKGAFVPHIEYERIGTNPADGSGVFLSAEGNRYEFRYPNDPVILEKLSNLVSGRKKDIYARVHEVLTLINPRLTNTPELKDFVSQISDMYYQMVRRTNRKTAKEVLRESVLGVTGTRTPEVSHILREIENFGIDIIELDPNQTRKFYSDDTFGIGSREIPWNTTPSAAKFGMTAQPSLRTLDDKLTENFRDEDGNSMDPNHVPVGDYRPTHQITQELRLVSNGNPLFDSASYTNPDTADRFLKRVFAAVTYKTLFTWGGRDLVTNPMFAGQCTLCSSTISDELQAINADLKPEFQILATAIVTTRQGHHDFLIVRLANGKWYVMDRSAGGVLDKSIYPDELLLGFYGELPHGQSKIQIPGYQEYAGVFDAYDVKHSRSEGKGHFVLVLPSEGTPAVQTLWVNPSLDGLTGTRIGPKWLKDKIRQDRAFTKGLDAWVTRDVLSNPHIQEAIASLSSTITYTHEGKEEEYESSGYVYGIPINEENADHVESTVNLILDALEKKPFKSAIVLIGEPKDRARAVLKRIEQEHRDSTHVKVVSFTKHPDYSFNKSTSERALSVIAGAANGGQGANLVVFDADNDLTEGPLSADSVVTSLTESIEEGHAMVTLNAPSRRFDSDDALNQWISRAFLQGVYGNPVQQPSGGDFAISAEANHAYLKHAASSDDTLVIDHRKSYDAEHSILVLLTHLMQRGEWDEESQIVELVKKKKIHQLISLDKVINRLRDELLPTLLNDAIRHATEFAGEPIDQKRFFDLGDINRLSREGDAKLRARTLENIFTNRTRRQLLDLYRSLRTRSELDAQILPDDSTPAKFPGIIKSDSVDDFKFTPEDFGGITQKVIKLYADTESPEGRTKIIDAYLPFVIGAVLSFGIENQNQRLAKAMSRDSQDAWVKETRKAIASVAGTRYGIPQGETTDVALRTRDKLLDQFAEQGHGDLEVDVSEIRSARRLLDPTFFDSSSFQAISVLTSGNHEGITRARFLYHMGADAETPLDNNAYASVEAHAQQQRLSPFKRVTLYKGAVEGSTTDEAEIGEFAGFWAPEGINNGLVVVYQDPLDGTKSAIAEKDLESLHLYAGFSFHLGVGFEIQKDANNIHQLLAVPEARSLGLAYPADIAFDLVPIPDTNANDPVAIERAIVQNFINLARALDKYEGDDATGHFVNFNVPIFGKPPYSRLRQLMREKGANVIDMRADDVGEQEAAFLLATGKIDAFLGGGKQEMVQAAFAAALMGGDEFVDKTFEQMAQDEELAGVYLRTASKVRLKPSQATTLAEGGAYDFAEIELRQHAQVKQDISKPIDTRELFKHARNPFYLAGGATSEEDSSHELGPIPPPEWDDENHTQASYHRLILPDGTVLQIRIKNRQEDADKYPKLHAGARAAAASSIANVFNSYAKNPHKSRTLSQLAGDLGIRGSLKSLEDTLNILSTMGLVSKAQGRGHKTTYFLTKELKLKKNLHKLQAIQNHLSETSDLNRANPDPQIVKRVNRELDQWLVQTRFDAILTMSKAPTLDLDRKMTRLERAVSFLTSHRGELSYLEKRRLKSSVVQGMIDLLAAKTADHRQMQNRVKFAIDMLVEYADIFTDKQKRDIRSVLKKAESARLKDVERTLLVFDKDGRLTRGKRIVDYYHYAIDGPMKAEDARESYGMTDEAIQSIWDKLARLELLDDLLTTLKILEVTKSRKRFERKDIIDVLKDRFDNRSKVGDIQKGLDDLVEVGLLKRGGPGTVGEDWYQLTDKAKKRRDLVRIDGATYPIQIDDKGKETVLVQDLQEVDGTLTHMGTTRHDVKRIRNNPDKVLVDGREETLIFSPENGMVTSVPYRGAAWAGFQDTGQFINEVTEQGALLLQEFPSLITVPHAERMFSKLRLARKRQYFARIDGELYEIKKDEFDEEYVTVDGRRLSVGRIKTSHDAILVDGERKDLVRRRSQDPADHDKQAIFYTYDRRRIDRPVNETPMDLEPVHLKTYKGQADAVFYLLGLMGLRGVEFELWTDGIAIDASGGAESSNVYNLSIAESAAQAVLRALTILGRVKGKNMVTYDDVLSLTTHLLNRRLDPSEITSILYRTAAHEFADTTGGQGFFSAFAAIPGRQYFFGGLLGLDGKSLNATAVGFEPLPEETVDWLNEHVLLVQLGQSFNEGEPEERHPFNALMFGNIWGGTKAETLDAFVGKGTYEQGHANARRMRDLTTIMHTAMLNQDAPLLAAATTEYTQIRVWFQVVWLKGAKEGGPFERAKEDHEDSAWLEKLLSKSGGVHPGDAPFLPFKNPVERLEELEKERLALRAEFDACGTGCTTSQKDALETHLAKNARETHKYETNPNWEYDEFVAMAEYYNFGWGPNGAGGKGATMRYIFEKTEDRTRFIHDARNRTGFFAEDPDRERMGEVTNQIAERVLASPGKNRMRGYMYPNFTGTAELDAAIHMNDEQVLVFGIERGELLDVDKMLYSQEPRQGRPQFRDEPPQISRLLPLSAEQQEAIDDFANGREYALIEDQRVTVEREYKGEDVKLSVTINGHKHDIHDDDRTFILLLNNKQIRFVREGDDLVSYRRYRIRQEDRKGEPVEYIERDGTKLDVERDPRDAAVIWVSDGRDHVYAHALEVHAPLDERNRQYMIQMVRERTTEEVMNRRPLPFGQGKDAQANLVLASQFRDYVIREFYDEVLDDHGVVDEARVEAIIQEFYPNHNRPNRNYIIVDGERFEIKKGRNDRHWGRDYEFVEIGGYLHLVERIPIDDPRGGGDMYARLYDRDGNARKVRYSIDVLDDEEYRKRLVDQYGHTITYWHIDQLGGAGNRLRRKEALQRFARLEGIDPASVSTTTKATDIGYEIRNVRNLPQGPDGSTRKTVVVKQTEVKLRRLMHLSRSGTYKRVKYQVYVNPESWPAVEAILNKPYEAVKKTDQGVEYDAERSRESYLDALADAGVEIVPRKEQGKYPGTHYRTNISNTDDDAEVNLGGNGFWGFSTLMDFLEMENPPAPEDNVIMGLANGEDASQVADPAIVADMVRWGVAFRGMNLTSGPGDISTGKNAASIHPGHLTPDGRTRLTSSTVEAADQRASGFEAVFQGSGQPGGVGEEGRQHQNAGFYLINVGVTVRMLKGLENIIGKGALMNVITPDYIQNPPQKGYQEIDGASSSDIQRLVEYLYVGFIFDKELGHEQKSAIANLAADILGRDETGAIRKIMDFIEIPLDKRTRYYLPLKDTFAAYLLMYGKRMWGLDIDSWVYQDAKEDGFVLAPNTGPFQSDEQITGDAHRILQTFGEADTGDLVHLGLGGSGNVVLTDTGIVLVPASVLKSKIETLPDAMRAGGYFTTLNRNDMVTRFDSRSLADIPDDTRVFVEREWTGGEGEVPLSIPTSVLFGLHRDVWNTDVDLGGQVRILDQRQGFLETIPGPQRAYYSVSPLNFRSEFVRSEIDRLHRENPDLQDAIFFDEFNNLIFDDALLEIKAMGDRDNDRIDMRLVAKRVGESVEKTQAPEARRKKYDVDGLIHEMRDEWLGTLVGSRLTEKKPSLAGARIQKKVKKFRGPRPEPAEYHTIGTKRVRREDNIEIIHEFAETPITATWMIADGERHASRPTETLDSFLNNMQLDGHERVFRGEAEVRTLIESDPRLEEYVIVDLSNRVFDSRSARERREAEEVARRVNLKLKQGRILVVGGDEGLLGQAYVQYLLDQGYQVVSMDDEKSGFLAHHRSNPNFQQIIDPEAEGSFNLVGNVHGVVNLSSPSVRKTPDSEPDIQASKHYTFRPEAIANFAEAQRFRLKSRGETDRVKEFRLVHVSPAEFYGNPHTDWALLATRGLDRSQGVTEDDRGTVATWNQQAQNARFAESIHSIRARFFHDDPDIPAKSRKRAAGSILEANRDRGVDARILRVGRILGRGMPMDDASVYAHIAGQLARGENVELQNIGSEEYGFTLNFSLLEEVIEDIETLRTVEIEPMKGESAEDNAALGYRNARTHSLAIDEAVKVIQEVSGKKASVSETKREKPENQSTYVDTAYVPLNSSRMQEMSGLLATSSETEFRKFVQDAADDKLSHAPPGQIRRFAVADDIISSFRKKAPKEPVRFVYENNKFYIEGDEPALQTLNKDEGFVRDPKRRLAVITGGAGGLGIEDIRRLLALGYQVIVLDNLVTSSIRNLEAFFAHPEHSRNLALIQHDASLPFDLVDGATGESFNTDLESYMATHASPATYHIFPERTQQTGPMQIYYALERARRQQIRTGGKGPRVHYTSTSEVKGDPPDEVIPTSEKYPGYRSATGWRSQYDTAKATGEARMWAYHERYGIDIFISNTYNTVGQPMHWGDGRLVTNQPIQALRGQPIPVYGRGGRRLPGERGDVPPNTRSMIRVFDQMAAQITAQTIEPDRRLSDVMGQVLFNIGNGLLSDANGRNGEISIYEFAKLTQEVAAEMVDGEVSPITHTNWSAYVHVARGEVQIVSDESKLTKFTSKEDAERAANKATQMRKDEFQRNHVPYDGIEFMAWPANKEKVSDPDGEYMAVLAVHDKSDPGRRQPDTTDAKKLLGWHELTLPWLEAGLPIDSVEYAKEAILQIQLYFLSLPPQSEVLPGETTESHFDLSDIRIRLDFIMDRARNKAYQEMEIKLLIDKFNQFHFSKAASDEAKAELLNRLLVAFSQNLLLRRDHLLEDAYAYVAKQGLINSIDFHEIRLNIQKKLDQYVAEGRRLHTLTLEGGPVWFKESQTDLGRGRGTPILAGEVIIRNNYEYTNGNPREAVLTQPKFRNQLPRSFFENNDRQNGRMLLRNVEVTISKNGKIRTRPIHVEFEGRASSSTSAAGVFDAIRQVVNTDEAFNAAYIALKLGINERSIKPAMDGLVELDILTPPDEEGFYSLNESLTNAADREEISILLNETLPTVKSLQDENMKSFISPIIQNIMGENSSIAGSRGPTTLNIDLDEEILDSSVSQRPLDVLEDKKDEIAAVLFNRFGGSVFTIKSIGHLESGSYKAVFRITALTDTGSEIQFALRFHTKDTGELNEHDILISNHIEAMSGESVGYWRVWSRNDFPEDISKKFSSLRAPHPDVENLHNEAVSIGDYKTGIVLREIRENRSPDSRLDKLQAEFPKVMARIWLGSVEKSAEDGRLVGYAETDLINWQNNYIYSETDGEPHISLIDVDFVEKVRLQGHNRRDSPAQYSYPGGQDISPLSQLAIWGDAGRRAFFVEMHAILHGRRENMTDKQRRIRNRLDETGLISTVRSSLKKHFDKQNLPTKKSEEDTPPVLPSSGPSDIPQVTQNRINLNEARLSDFIKRMREIAKGSDSRPSVEDLYRGFEPDVVIEIPFSSPTESGNIPDQIAKLKRAVEELKSRRGDKKLDIKAAIIVVAELDQDDHSHYKNISTIVNTDLSDPDVRVYVTPKPEADAQGMRYDGKSWSYTAGQVIASLADLGRGTAFVNLDGDVQFTEAASAGNFLEAMVRPLIEGGVSLTLFETPRKAYGDDSVFHILQALHTSGLYGLVEEEQGQPLGGEHGMDAATLRDSLETASAFRDRSYDLGLAARRIAAAKGRSIHVTRSKGKTHTPVVFSPVLKRLSERGIPDLFDDAAVVMSTANHPHAVHLQINADKPVTFTVADVVPEGFPDSLIRQGLADLPDAGEKLERISHIIGNTQVTGKIEALISNTDWRSSDAGQDVTADEWAEAHTAFYRAYAESQNAEDAGVISELYGIVVLAGLLGYIRKLSQNPDEIFLNANNRVGFPYRQAFIKAFDTAFGRERDPNALGARVQLVATGARLSARNLAGRGEGFKRNLPVKVIPKLFGNANASHSLYLLPDTEPVNSSWLAEFYVDPDTNELSFKAIRHANNYNNGETLPADYSISDNGSISKKLSGRFTDAQLERIKIWILSHPDHEGVNENRLHEKLVYPRLRIRLDAVDLAMHKNLNDALLIHANAEDNALYMGEHMAQHIFSPENQRAINLIDDYFYQDELLAGENGEAYARGLVNAETASEFTQEVITAVNELVEFWDTVATERENAAYWAYAKEHDKGAYAVHLDHQRKAAYRQILNQYEEKETLTAIVSGQVSEKRSLSATNTYKALAERARLILVEESWKTIERAVAEHNAKVLREVESGNTKYRESDRINPGSIRETSWILHANTLDKYEDSLTSLTNNRVMTDVESNVRYISLRVADDIRFQEVMQYFRFNPSIRGVIPAAGRHQNYKRDAALYLDSVDRKAGVAGSDPVYKNGYGSDGTVVTVSTNDLGVSTIAAVQKRLQDFGREKGLHRTVVLVVGLGATGAYVFAEALRAANESQHGPAFVIGLDMKQQALSETDGILTTLFQARQDKSTAPKHKLLTDPNDIVGVLRDLRERGLADSLVVINATGLGKGKTLQNAVEGEQMDAPGLPYREMLGVFGKNYAFDMNYRPAVTLFLAMIYLYGHQQDTKLDNAGLITAYINASHHRLLTGESHPDEFVRAWNDLLRNDEINDSTFTDPALVDQLKSIVPRIVGMHGPIEVPWAEDPGARVVDTAVSGARIVETPAGSRILTKRAVAVFASFLLLVASVRAIGGAEIAFAAEAPNTAIVGSVRRGVDDLGVSYRSYDGTTLGTESLEGTLSRKASVTTGHKAGKERWADARRISGQVMDYRSMQAARERDDRGVSERRDGRPYVASISLDIFDPDLPLDGKYFQNYLAELVYHNLLKGDVMFEDGTLEQRRKAEEIVALIREKRPVTGKLVTPETAPKNAFYVKLHAAGTAPNMKPKVNSVHLKMERVSADAESRGEFLPVDQVAVIMARTGLSVEIETTSTGDLVIDPVSVSSLVSAFNGFLGLADKGRVTVSGVIGILSGTRAFAFGPMKIDLNAMSHLWRLMSTIKIFA